MTIRAGHAIRHLKNPPIIAPPGPVSWILAFAGIRKIKVRVPKSSSTFYLDSNLATKGDIAKLKESTTAQIAELRSEMAEFKASIRGELAEFKDSIMAEISQLKRRDDHLQAQISHLKWIMIFNLSFTVTIMWKVFS